METQNIPSNRNNFVEKKTNLKVMSPDFKPYFRSIVIKKVHGP